jgi:hypothetical protein
MGFHCGMRKMLNQISLPFDGKVQIANPLMKDLNTIKQCQSISGDSCFIHHFQVSDFS